MFVHMYMCSVMHIWTRTCVCKLVSDCPTPPHPSFQLIQRLGSSVRNEVSAYVFHANGWDILFELRSKCANNSRITSTGEVCLERVQETVDFTIFADTHTHIYTETHVHTHVHTDLHNQTLSEQATARLALDVVQCHPGYAFNRTSSTCVCRRGESYWYTTFNCAPNQRYIYVPVSVYRGKVVLS